MQLYPRHQCPSQRLHLQLRLQGIQIRRKVLPSDKIKMPSEKRDNLHDNEGPGQMWERVCLDYQGFGKTAVEREGKEKEKEEEASGL